MTSLRQYEEIEWQQEYAQEAYNLQASMDDFKWFSKCLSEVLAIHRKKSKKKLNASDRIKLKQAYEVIEERVMLSVPELFREKNSSLRNQGLVGPFTGVAMAFATEFFEALASCISARRGTSNNNPSSEVADLIADLVGKLASFCLFSSTLQKTWEPERMFKKLEATGILNQFLFCSAISKEKVSEVAISAIHGKLLKCPVFVGKKLKKGTPCGDTARAILASTTYHPLATRYLGSLVKLSAVMQPNNSQFDVCQCCRTPKLSQDFQSNLMQCSRCRIVSYCSKECQTTDWKKHKKTCKCLAKLSESESGPKHSEALIHLLKVFTQTNYVSIMEAFVTECDKSGVQKKEMVVEVSFAPRKLGQIPALQDPPEFSIVPFQQYLDGSPQLDGIWNSEGLTWTTREELKSRILDCLKRQHSSLSSTGLLCLCNHGDGSSLLPIVQEQQSQIYTQEAVNAFRLAMNDNDFGPIAEICRGDDKIMDLLRSQMGMPDDENVAPNGV